MDLTLGNLLGIVTPILGAIIGILKIGALIRSLEKEHLAALQSLRDEASAARSKIYERLEAMRTEMAGTYVRQDVQEETIYRLMHAMEEHARVISAATAETESATPKRAVRPRKTAVKQ
jgi:hypothetical protein